MKKVTNKNAGFAKAGERVRFIRTLETTPFAAYDLEAGRWIVGHPSFDLKEYQEIPDTWTVEECTEADYDNWVMQNLL